MGVDARTNRLTNTVPCNTAGTPTCVAASSAVRRRRNLRGALNGDEYDIDPLNAIIERRGVGGLRQRYLYDADGERMAILYMPPTGSTPANIDFTLRGASRRCCAWSASPAPARRHVELARRLRLNRNDKLLASVVAGRTTTGKREHFHPDHLGTPRLITDDRGYRIALHTYWPFGQDAPASDADGERMKFTGHERDLASTPSATSITCTRAIMVRWRGGSCRWIPQSGPPHNRSRGIGTRTFGTTRWAKSTRPDVAESRRSSSARRRPARLPRRLRKRCRSKTAPWTSLCLAQSPQRPTPPAMRPARGSLCSATTPTKVFYAGDIGALGWEIGSEQNYYGTFNGSETDDLDPSREHQLKKSRRRRFRSSQVPAAGRAATRRATTPASISLEPPRRSGNTARSARFFSQASPQTARARL